jgi:predicted oxidoreductase
MIPRMSPLTLSPVVAGAWRLRSRGQSPQALAQWIGQCVELGVTSFDHADVYGDYEGEALFGAALALIAPSLRSRLQLVTKCGIRLVCANRPNHAIKSYDSSPEHIRASIEQSLRNLGVEQLELVLLHRPDFLAEPGEIAALFARLQQEGKVRHFGASNFSTSQLSLLHARTPLQAHQFEFSPLHLEALSDGTLDQALQLPLIPMAWSPMAGGRLLTATDEQALRTRAALENIAGDYGTTLIGATVAWIRRHPARPVPILGTRRVQSLQEAMAALPITLDRQSWYGVWSAATGREVP